MNQKIILSLAVMLTATVSQAQSLTLDQYLGQVRAGNDGYKSSIATADGAPNKSADADMVLSTLDRLDISNREKKLKEKYAALILDLTARKIANGL